MNYSVRLTHWTDGMTEVVSVFAESVHGALCAAVEGRSTVYKVEVLGTAPPQIDIPGIPLIEVPHLTA